MARIDKGAWVLIADSEKALFLENVGDEQDYNLEVRRKDLHDNPKTSEQGANKPGRMQDTGVRQMSAMEDTDWHELEKERFADDLAELLYKRGHDGGFDKIVLVAAPQTLGHLRKKLHKEVEAKVVGEVAKDLTHLPLDQIEKRLQEEFAPAR